MQSPLSFIKITPHSRVGRLFLRPCPNHFLPPFFMLVKLLWNLGTLILLVNVFHEKPKSKYFSFFNMKGCGRGSGEKAFVTRFVVAVAFLCPEVLGRGWALSCFVFFATGGLPPLSPGRRLFFPYLFIFTKAAVVFRRGRVNGLWEKGFVWDRCFDLASGQGCAALTKSSTPRPHQQQRACASRLHLRGLGKDFSPHLTPEAVEMLTPQGSLAL